MNTSPNMIKRHRQNLLAKLSVETRMAPAHMAASVMGGE